MCVSFKFLYHNTGEESLVTVSGNNEGTRRSLGMWQETGNSLPCELADASVSYLSPILSSVLGVFRHMLKGGYLKAIRAPASIKRSHSC